MTLYEKAWQAMRERIAAAAVAAGRDPGSVAILAVSKTHPPEAVRAAYALGQRAFGENYVQEAVDKVRALDGLPGIEWHLIGPLQGNKARAAAAHFAWVQSVDRLAIAERLSAARDPARGRSERLRAGEHLRRAEQERLRSGRGARPGARSGEAASAGASRLHGHRKGNR